MSDENEVPQINGNGNRVRMPSNSTIVGTVGGVGAAPFIIWLLEAVIHQPVPTMAAASLGGLLGQLSGYLFEGGRKRT